MCNDASDFQQIDLTPAYLTTGANRLRIVSQAVATEDEEVGLWLFAPQAAMHLLNRQHHP